MARKLFISFLGTNNYRTCEYVRDGISYGRTRFVQESTFRYLLSMEDWSNENNRILILLTKKAEEVNWRDGTQLDYETKEPLSGLASSLKQFPVQTETIRNIPEGINENEIWSIFDLIFNYLQDEDELYFDLTHGFRYLPMLVLVLGNYAKFLKQVTVKSVTYGNWEMSEKGSKPAPIIDLLPLTSLQDWTFAAGQFLTAGNVDRLIELSQNEITPLLRDSKGKNSEAQNLRHFINYLQAFVEDARSCRGIPVIQGERFNKLKQNYSKVNGHTERPYMPIFQKILEGFSAFKDSFDPQNGIQMAKWCYEKGLYQQSATFLEESILFQLALDFNLDPLNRDNQVLISGAMDYAANMHKTNNKEPKDYSPEIMRYGLLVDKQKPGLAISFANLRGSVRNDYNHAGIRLSPRDGDALKKSLGRLLMALSETTIANATEKGERDLKKIFINLSNHPSDTWSEKQMNEARRFGEIKDLAFPHIEPRSTPYELDFIADQTIRSILEYDPDYTTIHIMGEMTMVFRLVSRLKALGFRCVASTTERDVTYIEDSAKIARFSFIRFREY